MEALGRDNERDDVLAAISPLVTAVAVLAQVRFASLDIALEVGAGQVVQQHVELRAEQLAPAALEELESGRPRRTATLHDAATDDYSTTVTWFRVPIFFAGTPPQISPGPIRTPLVTTAPVDTIALSPIVTPVNTIAPAPMVTLLPIRIR